MDTGNNYGDGGSEERTGHALTRTARRGCRPSLSCLGVDRLELVHLHDPKQNTFAEAMAQEGSVATLIALRNEGLSMSVQRADRRRWWSTDPRAPPREAR